MLFYTSPRTYMCIYTIDYICSPTSGSATFIPGPEYTFAFSIILTYMLRTREIWSFQIGTETYTSYIQIVSQSYAMNIAIHGCNILELL